MANDGENTKKRKREDGEGSSAAAEDTPREEDGVVFRLLESYDTVLDENGCKIDDELSLWPPCVDFIWFCYAKIALSDYEKQQNAEFEIVGLYPYTYKPLVFIPEIDERMGDWVHISFIAIPKGADVDDVTSRKLFFAELFSYAPRKIKVTHCSIVEPNDPGITHGCGICNPDEKIAHPSSGYLLGHWAYEKRGIPNSAYESHWFKEEVDGSRRLDLDKLFKGKVPKELVRRRMKSPDFAEIALKLNKKGEDDVEFEVVKGLGYSRCGFVHIPGKPGMGQLGEWVHVSFTAKLKNNVEDSPSLLFLAELCEIGSEKEYSLSMCCILKPDDPGITYGCGFCDPKSKIAHAPDFVAGRWSYQYPNDFGP